MVELILQRQLPERGGRCTRLRKSAEKRIHSAIRLSMCFRRGHASTFVQHRVRRRSSSGTSGCSGGSSGGSSVGGEWDGGRKRNKCA